MPYKDSAKRAEKRRERYEKNIEKEKEQSKESKAKRYEDRKKNTYDSITAGSIIDINKWNAWCNIIKSNATSNKHPYSECFTNDVIFKMMLIGCFYCGDIATTIDRINSKLDHTPENCVGCCYGCNMSKGVADPATFIRKAYYRVHEKYYDSDNDIWFVNKQKPSTWNYKSRIKNKELPFSLTKEEWEKLIRGNCYYCRRSPTTWFGVDRVIPSLGYVPDNVVSCCYDCNLDKSDSNVDIMKSRNERIVERVDAGELMIEDCEKVVFIYQGARSSNKVCVRGKVYSSKITASSALVMGDSYIGECIRNKKYTDDIFEISVEFYEEYKDSDMYITKNMFIAFEHFYTNI
jgi:5-methylcytosine-specific restriction endonuclease McrA